MPRFPAAVLLALLALLALAACDDGRAAGRLEIAAASSLRPVLEELTKAFALAHPGHAPRVAYGASGTLLTQIRQGAPFALFLSADAEAPAVLHAQGRGQEPFAYARGRLVVWTPHDSALDLAGKGLTALRECHRIAIANPEHAPYGKAALAILDRADLLAELRPRLVLGENVAQAAHFARTGAADAALIAEAQARAPEMVTHGRSWRVPDHLHPGLRHCGIALTDDPAVTAFVRFLHLPEAQALLRRHGYEPLDD